jgi:dihydropyrimidine dehydrogenase (NAD+) subunit PreA
MCSGYGVVREMKTGLSAYLKRKNLQSPDELVGRTLPLLTSHQNLSRIDRIRPVIKNQDACIRCGTCVIACRDGGYQAIKLTDDGPVVDLSRCDGCGLCILVCSVKALIAHKIRV